MGLGLLPDDEGRHLKTSAVCGIRDRNRHGVGPDHHSPHRLYFGVAEHVEHDFPYELSDTRIGEGGPAIDIVSAELTRGQWEFRGIADVERGLEDMLYQRLRLIDHASSQAVELI